MNEIANTITYLRTCQRARAAGYPVAYTTDPAWLVQQAINRRAGWPDDESGSRGSCSPNAGGSTLPIGRRYPRKAEGTAQNHLRQIAYQINTPHLIVRPQSLGEWREWIEKRLPHRLTTEE